MAATETSPIARSVQEGDDRPLKRRKSLRLSGSAGFETSPGIVGRDAPAHRRTDGSDGQTLVKAVIKSPSFDDHIA
jgi:hypothetical protein